MDYFEFCNQVIYIWGLGADPYAFDSEFGIPLVENGFKNYVMEVNLIGLFWILQPSHLHLGSGLLLQWLWYTLRPEWIQQLCDVGTFGFLTLFWEGDFYFIPITSMMTLVYAWARVDLRIMWWRWQFYLI